MEEYFDIYDAQGNRTELRYYGHNEESYNAYYTYNENGTLNLYFHTQFSTTSPDIYYAVRLSGGFHDQPVLYYSNDPVFEITGLPFNTYTVQY